MVQENYHLYLATVTGLARSREDIENTVVDVVKGTPVLVKNLAGVVPGERPIYNIVTANGKPAVLVNVLQQPDGNALQIADSVNHELVEIKKTLAPDVHLATFYDQSILVRDSIGSVRDSILIGLGLSVAVLVGFLKSWRTTIVAALVIPVALLTAIVFMKLFHMSFNLMTLGGLAAAIGVVIDDAIVMVENISVHLSLGQSRSEAARSAIERTDARADRIDTDSHHGVRAAGVSGRHYRGVLPRAGDDDGDRAGRRRYSWRSSSRRCLARVFFRGPGAREAEAGPADLQQAEQAGEGRLMRWGTARYETALAWSLAHTQADPDRSGGHPGGLDRALYPARQRLFAGDGRGRVRPRLHHAAGNVAPGDRPRAAPHRTLPAGNAGSRELLAPHRRAPGAGDRGAEYRRFSGEAEARPPAPARRGHRPSCARRSRAAEPAIDVEFPHILEDLIGDLAWSPAAYRDQDLQQRSGEVQSHGQAGRAVAAEGEGRRGYREPDHRDRAGGEFPR